MVVEMSTWLVMKGFVLCSPNNPSATQVALPASIFERNFCAILHSTNDANV
jgi:hypothetical protein